MTASDTRGDGLRGLFDPVTLMLGGLVVLVGVIPFVAALVLYQLHSRAERDEAETNARRTATLLMRSFEQAIAPVDGLLLHIARTYEASATPVQVHAMLRGLSLPPAVLQVSVTDRAGALIASSLPTAGVEQKDLSGRDYMRTHLGRDSVHAGLFISKPVLGLLSKKWGIPLARPLVDDSGRFSGVAVASYAISDFIDFYKQLRTEDGMLIALVGRDGIVRARAAGTTSFGDDVSASPAFQAALAHGGATYEEVSVVDGVARVGYTVASGKYPILVTVAYALAHVQQQSDEFRAAIWSTALGLSIALLIVVLLGGRYLNLQKRLKANEVQALARQREANVLEAISRVPGVAVMHVTAAGASEVGTTSNSALSPVLRRYLASGRFRALVRGLREPQLRDEHLSDGSSELEVEMVVAPLQGMERVSSPGEEQDMVVFAVDRTERRMEENKLYQMSKLASLGEVATGLAHEINQPLGVIRLAASNALTGLKMGLPAEHLSAKLDRIIQQTVRMSRIIDHMRIFGRTSEEQLQPSQPTHAVEGALQVVGAHFRLDEIEVIPLFEPDLPEVLCRQDQLEQVIINLLQNARDAINERRAVLREQLGAYLGGHSGEPFAGRIGVRIAREARTGAPEQVLIEVADNGGGIPEAVVERIFQPFFTTKPPGKGTGLGLSVSFGIIRDHGGRLSVRNGSEGAIFSIRLPARLAAPAQPRAAEG
ncbi:ATP-binding protein [Xanthobacter autotrophicus]|uniref:ATP-binding protein n=1 Tax=Xanthobacter autotrophicus TaxID=280 RepID=UPI00372869E5